MGGNAIIITIADQEYRPRAGTFNIKDRIEERAVASFAIDDPEGEKTFLKGHPVEIKHNGALIFGGVIDKAVGTVLDNKKYKRHSISCIDYHYAADKRAVAAAYEKTKAGDIVRDRSSERTIGTILEEEGIKYFNILEDFKDYTLQQIVDGEVDV